LVTSVPKRNRQSRRPFNVGAIFDLWYLSWASGIALH
jgi:hypothetical protein